MLRVTLLIGVTFPIITNMAIAGRVITDRSLHVAMSSPWTGPYEGGKRLSCGFLVGLETVKERQLLPGYEIKFEVSDDLLFSFSVVFKEVHA